MPSLGSVFLAPPRPFTYNFSEQCSPAMPDHAPAATRISPTRGLSTKSYMFTFPEMFRFLEDLFAEMRRKELTGLLILFIIFFSASHS